MNTIEFIVVHTGQPGVTAQPTTGNEPAFHLHVNPRGKLLRLRNLKQNSALGNRTGTRCLCISMEGNLKSATSKMPLSRAQEDVLFDQIVLLTEKYPGARVVGKEYFDGKEYPGRQFDVRAWLGSYVPDLVMAA